MTEPIVLSEGQIRRVVALLLEQHREMAAAEETPWSPTRDLRPKGFGGVPGGYRGQLRDKCE